MVVGGMLPRDTEMRTVALRCEQETGVLDSEVNCSPRERRTLPGKDLSSRKGL